MSTEVVVLAEHGLGFGDGTISTRSQIEKGRLTERDLATAKEIITHVDDVFTTIARDIADDGCGDGRPTIDTWVTDDEGNEIHYNKSSARAKLFGGGLVAASSMWRVLKGTPSEGETALGDRSFVAGTLHEKGIQFGAHCDAHATGENCGCGAIDRYLQITADAVRFETQIREVLQVLYGEGYAPAAPAIDVVFAQYQAQVQHEEFYANASGEATMELLESEGAVIKKLDGNHEEDIIVLNDVEGTTLDQPKFDALLKAEGIEQPLQAFVVDVWRGRMYADVMAGIASEQGLGEDVEALRQIAYADFLIRTLAVAATLTGGDLPVLARRPEGRAHFALTA